MCLTTWPCASVDNLTVSDRSLPLPTGLQLLFPSTVDNQVVCYCSQVARQLGPSSVTFPKYRWQLAISYRPQVPCHSLNTKHSFTSCHYRELYAWLVPQNQRTILVDGLWIESYNGKTDMTNLKCWINKKGTQKVRF